MRRVELTIAFIDDDGARREESHTIQTSGAPDVDGEHRLTHILTTELNVTVGKQAEPRHNAIARAWLKFPNSPAGIDQYLNIRNSQGIWLELTNLIMGAEADLILAQAYKALEPPREPPFEDDRAINDLYYTHSRKMTLLNGAVQNIIRVQDLVNRLLHESLGGDLVDTSKPKWEKSQLTREKVEKQLESRRLAGALSQADFDAIVQALAIPNNKQGTEIAQAYRNQLTHHVQPSVDYSMFFSSLESREGEEIKDPQGKVIRRVYRLLAQPPVEYKFDELFESCSKYLDALVAMLETLGKVGLLRR